MYRVSMCEWPLKNTYYVIKTKHTQSFTYIKNPEKGFADEN